MTHLAPREPISPAPRRQTISVVTPCYNEVDNVAECHRAVKRVFDQHLPEFALEHLFCDNASTDGTGLQLARMCVEYPEVRVILNARNFGPFRSVFNGLLATTGDAVVVFLPADQQDPPEVIPELVRHWKAGNEIVYGIRAIREESLLMRSMRGLYYHIIRQLSNIRTPADVGEFQLVDRCIVEALRRCDDYYPYIRGLIAHCGFNSYGVSYTWKRRLRGRTKNHFYSLIDQGLNGIISFTNVPLRICLLTGAALTAGSLALGSALWVAYSLADGSFMPPAIPALIFTLLFLSGIQLFFLGILGEYVTAIHFQVRRRPLVIERARLNFPTPLTGATAGDDSTPQCGAVPPPAECEEPARKQP